METLLESELTSLMSFLFVKQDRRNAWLNIHSCLESDSHAVLCVKLSASNGITLDSSLLHVVRPNWFWYRDCTKKYDAELKKSLEMLVWGLKMNKIILMSKHLNKSKQGSNYFDSSTVKVILESFLLQKGHVFKNDC